MALDTVELARIADRVSECARTDVSGLSDEKFMEAQHEVARLRKVADSLMARFAGEAERRSGPGKPGGGLARTHGHGNANKFVANITGGSGPEARRLIQAGRAMVPDSTAGEVRKAKDKTAAPAPARFPVITAAQVSGELSLESAGIIAESLAEVSARVAAERLRELESRLVKKAKKLTATEVKRMVKRALARFDEQGLKERERQNFDNRYVAWTEDRDGMVHLTAKLDAVTAAPIRTVIDQMVTLQFRKRRDQDPQDPDKRTPGQMRADALFDLSRHALGCTEMEKSGVRTSLVVRVGLDDLNTGAGVGTIDGTDTPVSVGELRRVAGDAGVIPAVLGGNSEVLDLGTMQRRFTPAQRMALLERDGGCAMCHAPPEHCEAHHIDWWRRDNGPTDLSNGLMLCTRCHHDVHRLGWQIEIVDGHVLFLPPPDADFGREAFEGARASVELDPHAINTNTLTEQYDAWLANTAAEFSEH